MEIDLSKPTLLHLKMEIESLPFVRKAYVSDKRIPGTLDAIVYSKKPIKITSEEYSDLLMVCNNNVPVGININIQVKVSIKDRIKYLLNKLFNKVG